MNKKPKKSLLLLWVIMAGALIGLISTLLPFGINSNLADWEAGFSIWDEISEFVWLIITPIGLSAVLILALGQLILIKVRKKGLTLVMLILSMVFIAPLIEVLPRYSYNNSIGSASWRLGPGFYMLMIGGLASVTGTVLQLLRSKSLLGENNETK